MPEVVGTPRAHATTPTLKGLIVGFWIVTGAHWTGSPKHKHLPNWQKMSKKCPKIVFSSPSGQFLDIFGTLFKVDIPFFWAVQRFACYKFWKCFVFLLKVVRRSSRRSFARGFGRVGGGGSKCASKAGGRGAFSNLSDPLRMCLARWGKEPLPTYSISGSA